MRWTVAEEQAGRPFAGRQLGEELADVGRAGGERVEVMGVEVLAVLVQVGAVGVEGVAGEASLQLQVGEEVEDQALEAGLGLRRIGDDHGREVLLSSPQPLIGKGPCVSAAGPVAV